MPMTTIAADIPSPSARNKRLFLFFIIFHGFFQFLPTYWSFGDVLNSLACIRDILAETIGRIRSEPCQSAARWLFLSQPATKVAAERNIKQRLVFHDSQRYPITSRKPWGKTLPWTLVTLCNFQQCASGKNFRPYFFIIGEIISKQIAKLSTVYSHA